MSETTTNPLLESSGSVSQAAEAFAKLENPQESEAKAEDQPVVEEQEESTADVEAEAQETETEETEEVQPEVEEEGAEEAEDVEKFLIGDEEVTADQIVEWKNNGLMQADYTRKQQALAEERRSFEAEKEQELTTLRTEYEHKLAQFADVVIDDLKQFEGKDWDKLRAEDPYQYQLDWADFQRAQIRAQQANQAILQESEALTAEQAQARQIRLQEAAQQLPKLIPEWEDVSVRDSELTALSTFLKNEGMGDDAIKSIEDPVAYRVIRKAWLYDNLNNKVKTVGKKKVSPVTKVVKPGSSSSKATIVERDAAAAKQKMNKLRETGRAEDAADFFRMG